MHELQDYVTGLTDGPSPIFAGNGPLNRLASSWRFIACLQVIDFLVFFAAGFLWFQSLAQANASDLWFAQIVVAILAAAMTHCVFHCFRLYEFAVLLRGREAAIRALFAGGMAVGPLLAALLIRTDIANSSIETTTALLATGCAGTALLRLPLATLAKTLRQAGVVGRRVYIIADHPDAAASLTGQLRLTRDSHVVGVWCLSQQQGPLEAAIEGALVFLRHIPVDSVILKLPLSEPDRLIEVVRILRRLPRQVLLAPMLNNGDDLLLNLGAGTGADFGNTMLVKISDRPLSGWRWVLKDLLDRSLALVLLAFVSPAMLIIAIAIKASSPGPVFFRQKRRGYAGDTFDIIKFRTMRAAPSSAGVLKLTTRDDPRIFPVGRILRKTSLDELPQLLNVLLGDMWIIGPRPHSPLAQAGGMIYAEAVQEYVARYRVKPGITGWAQVCGWRGPTDTLEQLSKRVEHDLYYIENWSVFFDVHILFKTLFCVLGHTNAY